MSDISFERRNLQRHPPAYAPDYKSTALRAPMQKLLHYRPTETETTGPVFGHDLLGKDDADLIVNYAKPGGMALGPRVILHGTLRDESGRPVPGKLIEIWQANAAGRYRHKSDSYLAPLDDNFGGCGRCITDPDGAFQFRTIRPGPYPWPNGGNDWRPAHVHFSVFGDGFAQRLITQMYFEGDPHIALCPIVQSIPDKAAIETLVARLDISRTVPMDILAYRFDIILRGPRATMFENQMEGR